MLPHLHTKVLTMCFFIQFIRCNALNYMTLYDLALHHATLHQKNICLGLYHVSVYIVHVVDAYRFVSMDTNMSKHALLQMSMPVAAFMVSSVHPQEHAYNLYLSV